MRKRKNIFKEVTNAPVRWAVIMILLGIVAIALPSSSRVVISILAAWLLALGGLTNLASAIAGRSAGGFVWRVLIALVRVLGGAYVVFHPELPLQMLLRTLGVVFALESIAEFAVFLLFRAYLGSGWILLNTLLSLTLASIALLPWPLISSCGIGMILGLNLKFSGFNELMFSLAARRRTEAFAS